MSAQTVVAAAKKVSRNRNRILPQEEIVQQYKDRSGEPGLVPGLALKYNVTEQAIYSILRTHGLRKRIPVSVIISQQNHHNQQVKDMLLEMIQNSPLSDEAINYLQKNLPRFFFTFKDEGDTK